MISYAQSTSRIHVIKVRINIRVSNFMFYAQSTSRIHVIRVRINIWVSKFMFLRPVSWQNTSYKGRDIIRVRINTRVSNLMFYAQSTSRIQVIRVRIL